MRKAKPVRAKQKSVVRFNRAESYVMNVQYMGDEPSFEEGSVLTSAQIAKALNWYSYMESTENARDFCETFLRERGENMIAKSLGLIPNAFFPRTSGWVFRLIQRGYVIDADYTERAINRLVEEIERSIKRVDMMKKYDETPDPLPRPKKNTNKLIPDLEDVLDAHTAGKIKSFDVKQRLNNGNTSKNDVIDALKYYTPILNEMIEALRGKDKELIEGYNSKNGRKWLYDRVMFIRGILEQLDEFVSIKKQTQQKPRAKKPVSVERKLKNFKFKPNSVELKLTSIDPSKVIGSDLCFLFNTHNNMLMMYVAVSGQKLDIENNKIIGWDKTKSFMKRIGRDTERVVPPFKEYAKRMAVSTFETIKTKSIPCHGRSSPETLILRSL